MHLHLPKPLHGWREFAGEVGIIVIGVLIALGAEQVVEMLRWRREAREAIASIKDEVEDHYFAASEAMIATPCIDQQLQALEQRLLQPGRYAPAPMYSEGQTDYVFRTPDRVWSDNVWRSVQAQGIVSHFPSEKRLWLGAYYSEALGARENNAAIKLLDYQLRVLARPLNLDPPTRAHLVEKVEETRGRIKEQAVYASQMLRNAEDLDLQPTADALNKMLARSGTIKFCRTHHLPLGNNQDVL